MRVGIRLGNTSPLARKHWTRPIAIPYAIASNAPKECTFICSDGRQFRAVRCGRRAIHSIYFRIHITMEGNQLLDGVIIDTPFKTDHKFTPHKWVSDNLIALIPTAGVYQNGSITETTEVVSPPEIIDSSPCHQRLFMKLRNTTTGIVMPVYANVLHDDPVVSIRGKIAWSDRFDKNLTRSFDAIGLLSGEMFYPYFGTRNGWATPEKFGNKWGVVMGRNQTFLDGGCIPFAGNLLTFFGPGIDVPSNIDWNDLSNPDAMGLQSLKAAMHGPIFGVCLEWGQHHYLAGGNVARYNDTWANQERRWNEFKSFINTPGRMVDRRPYGLNYVPGSTGEQEDFGHTKLTQVVVMNDPRMLFAYEYCMHGTAMRPVHHYEADGKPLQSELHPNLRTYYGSVHFHHQVSPDRLGKGNPSDTITYAPPNPMLFENMDDEHYSINNDMAYLALTDDELADDIYRHRLVMDVCSYYNRFNVTAAARAEGRTVGGWAHMATLFEGKAGNDVVQLVDKRIVLNFNNPLMNVTGPVKVTAFHNPDQRKAIFEGATYLPSTSMWELALELEGFYKLLKSGVANELPKLQSVVATLCRTLARYGCFIGTDGKWYLVADMWYQTNGEEFTPFNETNRSKIVYQDNAGGVCKWVIAGLAIASEFLPDDDPLKLKAKTCVTFFVNLAYQTDMNLAEWLAAVKG